MIAKKERQIEAAYKTTWQTREKILVENGYGRSFISTRYFLFRSTHKNLAEKWFDSNRFNHLTYSDFISHLNKLFSFNLTLKIISAENAMSESPENLQLARNSTMKLQLNVRSQLIRFKSFMQKEHWKCSYNRWYDVYVGD